MKIYLFQASIYGLKNKVSFIHFLKSAYETLVYFTNMHVAHLLHFKTLIFGTVDLSHLLTKQLLKKACGPMQPIFIEGAHN